MKRAFLLLLPPLLLLAAAPALAQQEAQYSQYMNNNYLLNPGATGAEDYIDVKFSYRTQWVGLEGAPRTFYASVNSSLGKWRTTSKRTRRDLRRPFHALGGYVYRDETGPTSRTSGYVSYAYNVVLTPKIRAALGVSVGVQQFAVDGNKLQFFDQTTIAASDASRVPDASVGLWLYSPSVFVGLSSTQILANKLDFSYGNNQLGAGTGNSLKRHYFFTAGVRLPLTDDWSLLPSVLVKAVSPAPLAVDLNARLKYQDLIWAGVSYRLNDAAVAMVGFNYEQLAVGYSYDVGVSRLGPYHSGSHEILIGLRIKKKAQVVCIDRF